MRVRQHIDPTCATDRRFRSDQETKKQTQILPEIRSSNWSVFEGTCSMTKRRPSRSSTSCCGQAGEGARRRPFIKRTVPSCLVWTSSPLRNATCSAWPSWTGWSVEDYRPCRRARRSCTTVQCWRPNARPVFLAVRRPRSTEPYCRHWRTVPAVHWLPLATARTARAPTAASRP